MKITSLFLEMLKSDESFGLRTRHLNIKLYFNKQFVGSNDIIILFRSTDTMVAELLTKPLV